MVIFHSYVSLPEGTQIHLQHHPLDLRTKTGGFPVVICLGLYLDLRKERAERPGDGSKPEKKKTYLVQYTSIHQRFQARDITLLAVESVARSLLLHQQKNRSFAHNFQVCNVSTVSILVNPQGESLAARPAMHRSCTPERRCETQLAVRYRIFLIQIEHV